MCTACYLSHKQYVSLSYSSPISSSSSQSSTCRITASIFPLAFCSFFCSSFTILVILVHRVLRSLIFFALRYPSCNSASSACLFLDAFALVLAVGEGFIRDTGSGLEALEALDEGVHVFDGGLGGVVLMGVMPSRNVRTWLLGF